MPYRRLQTAGASHFFTAALADRRSALLVEHIAVLRQAVRLVRQRHPFMIDAMVVLPEHLHCIWTLPEGDRDCPLRWALIKSPFSRPIARGERIGASRQSKRERGIWLRRYWEQQLHDANDLNRHIDYTHHNPVKHGQVSTASAWPHSSIHRYIPAGILPEDWEHGGEMDGEFGE
ncbi:REP-associated tyrosine transposase [Chitinilyticum litopenaei]|uniref:REP-associated tyrosine transposase n=1 Tax=Chitinilyticum litopenaei TaxID=1121276 RepID=UPI0004916D39|nr:transposase [Chitinilyticum litopenaei]